MVVSHNISTNRDFFALLLFAVCCFACACVSIRRMPCCSVLLDTLCFNEMRKIRGGGRVGYCGCGRLMKLYCLSAAVSGTLLDSVSRVTSHAFLDPRAQQMLDSVLLCLTLTSTSTTFRLCAGLNENRKGQITTTCQINNTLPTTSEPWHLEWSTYFICVLTGIGS